MFQIRHIKFYYINTLKSKDRVTGHRHETSLKHRAATGSRAEVCRTARQRYRVLTGFRAKAVVCKNGFSPERETTTDIQPLIFDITTTCLMEEN